MTVSALREYMFEKVIPEKVMPQNIGAFLMDEDAEIPELNAFTFLTRLRSLGIGSADFLYLLKGCGAPASAVSRIENNPAMNLQSLIITLEDSELTSQDYTRMLYTARQLWERTLTMRLENMERALADNNRSDDYGVSDQEQYSREFSDGYEEQYSDEPPEEETYPDEPAEESYPDEPAEETYPEEPAEEIYPEEPPEEETYPDEPAEESTPAEPPSEYGYYSEETGEFIPINPEQLKQAVAEHDIADEPSDDDETPETARKPSEEELALKRSEERRAASPYHTGAIAASAAVAVVLFAAAAFLPRDPDAVKRTVLKNAESDGDIFARVYASYSAGDYALGDVFAYGEGDCEAFGGLLVEAPESGELGVYADDDFVYAAKSDAVTVYKYDNADLTAAGELYAPENTEFVRVFEREGEVFAVFAGEEADGDGCGFMKLDGEKPVYVSRQDGILTDIIIGNGTISLGSVCLPWFGENIPAEQRERYVPEAGGVAVAAENVLLCGSGGCGYAVSAEYLLEDGSAVSSRAVMGKPSFASADGRLCVMRSDEGSGEGSEEETYFADALSVSLSETENIACFAYEAGIAAVVPSGAEGVVLYAEGKEGEEGFQPVGALENLSERVSSLRLSGGILYIGGENGVFLAVDCSDPKKPELLQLTRANGYVTNGCALCCELTGAGAVFSLYKNDNGTAKLAASFTEQLNEGEKETFRFGGRNTVAVLSPAKCGAAFRYFDGVCVVSEFAVFGAENSSDKLYDDETGFTAVFGADDKLVAVGGEVVRR